MAPSQHHQIQYAYANAAMLYDDGSYSRGGGYISRPMYTPPNNGYNAPPQGYEIYAQHHQHHHHHHHHHHQHQLQQQRLPHQRGGYYQNQGRGGGPMGRGARRGGHYDSSHHQRGGGRGGMQRGSRHEHLCIIHVDSFETVNAANRSNTLISLIPPHVLDQASRGPRLGNNFQGMAIIRALLIVNKRFLVGSISEPRDTQNVIIPDSAAVQLMNVENVLCDEGHLVVEMESGAKIAKNLYGQLRHGLVQVVSFEPPTETPEPINVYAMDADTILKELPGNYQLFFEMEQAMREDSERSATLFSQILRLSSPSLTSTNTTEEPQQPAGEGDQASPPRRTHMLLRYPQGVRVLSLALESPTKRAMFFQRLHEEGEEVSRLYTNGIAPEGTLFLTLLSSALTAPIVFNSFGVETRENGLPVRQTDWADRSEIINVLCTRIASEGILLVRSNGGNCMITALAKRLWPDWKGEAPAAREPPRGSKRDRDDHESGTSQSVRTEGDTSANQATTEGRRAPASLDELVLQRLPQDWRFYEACVNAFTCGRVPERSAEQSGEVSANRGELSVEVRGTLVTDHIIACRAVQVLLPHFADVVLQHQKLYAGCDYSPYVYHCVEFLTSLATRARALMLSPHGNYVAQSLIVEFSPRAIPGTVIESVLLSFLNEAADNVNFLSLQKCASNVVERAISCCDAIDRQKHDEFILRTARGLLSNNDDRLTELATNQYGNYVCSHLCKKLTAVVTSEASSSGGSASAEMVEEATKLEAEAFARLYRRMREIQGSRFTAGLVSWLNAQEGRLRGAAPAEA